MVFHPRGIPEKLGTLAREPVAGCCLGRRLGLLSFKESSEVTPNEQKTNARALAPLSAPSQVTSKTEVGVECTGSAL